mmetsp:Transcript_18932/g.43716  ORF Transcript_18932/g.43716 Transcript_18932/m.43716 type:complete len:95 (-) Transcript_18932:117-401(-)
MWFFLSLLLPTSKSDSSAPGLERTVQGQEGLVVQILFSTEITNADATTAMAKVAVANRSITARERTAKVLFLLLIGIIMSTTVAHPSDGVLIAL